MTERWDVYDLDRRPVGLTRPRGFAHPPEQCQLVVHVCLFNKQGEMLIQRRSMAKKSYPGRWDVSVGGGVLAGETAREAAVREAREELGIEIDLTGPAAVTASVSASATRPMAIDAPTKPNEPLVRDPAMFS